MRNPESERKINQEKRRKTHRARESEIKEKRINPKSERKRNPEKEDRETRASLQKRKEQSSRE